MKKSIFATLALVALVGCSLDNTKEVSDKVSPTFSSATITRVATNNWEEDDQIGITMTSRGATTLAEGNYYNVPHTVDGAGAKAIFAPDSEVIYYPVDGTTVDFYAYYPFSTALSGSKLPVDISSQIFSDIDLVATKSLEHHKDAPVVNFSEEDAFKHQLSAVELNFQMGDGITSLEGLTTTIKGYYNTAKFDIYDFSLTEKSDIKDIEATTTVDGHSATAVAILIPTEPIEGSTMEFVVGGNNYIWDIADLEFKQGFKYTYTITVTRTRIVVEGSEIEDWNQGSIGSGTAW